MSQDPRTPAGATGPGTGRAAANFSQSAHAVAQAHASKLQSGAPAPAPASKNPHKHDSRLIQKPGAQHALPRTVWGVITGAFWVAYLYLWMPVATLVLWLLGIRSVASELYLRTHEVDPFLMLALPATAGVVVAMLLIWAEYNRWRFSSPHSERRGPQPNVALEQVASGLGASEDVALALNGGRVSVLHMDPNHAVPLSVTALTPELPSQPFPPLAMPKFTRQPAAPKNGWLLAVAMASIALVIGVLFVVSHGYRQIESTAPMQAIQGTPGIDRPALPFETSVGDEDSAPIIAGSSSIDGATVAKIAAAAAAKSAAAETARIAKTRASAERARRVADAASAKPRPLPGYSPKPAYPAEALRHQEGGLVNVRVQVSADGLPLKVDIGKRSGNRVLDRAAVATVRRWRFEPAKRDGKAVAAVVIVPVEFKPRN